MQNLLVVLATAEPSPGEDLREGLDPEMVTPGTLGFLATLFVVIATVFLIRDMAKRVRRVRYREQVQQQADEQDADDVGTFDGETSEGQASTREGPNRQAYEGQASDREASDRATEGQASVRETSNGDDGGGEPGDDGGRPGATSRLKNSNGAGPERKG
ncbi:MAG TPA: hypothetical protein VFI97_00235 [Arthrobacter sp.]|nr:hypothetical protein [Arthrobacter sp.]